MMAAGVAYGDVRKSSVHQACRRRSAFDRHRWLHRQPRPSQPGSCRTGAFAACPCAYREDRHRRGDQSPRCGRGLYLGRYGQRRLWLSRFSGDVSQCRRRQAGFDAAPATGPRGSALCRRGRRCGRGGEPGPGPGCRRAGRGRVRTAAVGHRDRGRTEVRCPSGLEGRSRQCRGLQSLR